jgi:hypothetical protein
MRRFGWDRWRGWARPHVDGASLGVVEGWPGGAALPWPIVGVVVPPVLLLPSPPPPPLVPGESEVEDRRRE